uniref:Uncharacterized protein n=1 Tax=Bactrocera dorsalis TaxID=27457 RepID=A0A034WLC4_BACDO
MAEYFVPQRNPKVYQQRKTSLASEDKKLYRFDDSSICWLANYLFEESEETRGGALSNVDKIRLYLRFCADPGFQNGIATDIGVHQSLCRELLRKLRNLYLLKQASG